MSIRSYMCKEKNFDYVSLVIADKCLQEELKAKFIESGEASKTQFIIKLLKDGLERREGTYKDESVNEIAKLRSEIQAQNKTLEAIYNLIANESSKGEVDRRLLFTLFNMMYTLGNGDYSEIKDFKNMVPFNLISQYKELGIENDS